MQLVLRQVRRFTHRRSQVFDNGKLTIDCIEARILCLEGTRWASPRGLPTEILLQIISYLMSDLRDVAVLNRTSKYFTAVTDALLYSSLRIGLDAPSCKPMSVPLNERRQALLYQGLQSPRFAELVTEFRIDFSWCGMRRPPILRRLRRVRCTCNRLDYLLGQALTSLTNLRILRFSCYCCADPTDSRHLYLQHLTTTKLRGLTFECQCMPAMSDKLFNICSASCMRSLLELKWPNPGNSAPNVSVRALIEDKKCLPKLVGLYIHDNVEAVSSILEKGIVKYLRCNVVNERLQELLDKHPGTLRSLRVKKKRITLPAKIAERPDTYRCLIRIGKLFYPSNEVCGFEES
jgi:hypothetical protein